MPAPISIVIPTLNAANSLPATLRSLMPALLEGLVLELVITDGGSTDATEEIAEEAGAVWISGAAGRGGQLRRGVEAASGDWLLILHADTQLSGDWLPALLRHMELSSERAGFFDLRFRAAGLMPAIVSGWANWRSRALGLPYGDQGLFLSRAVYDQVGGYADIPLMEDVALARALSGDPKFVLADEPTAHQDAAGSKIVIEALSAARERGAAVVITAHDPRLVEAGLADARWHLEDGDLQRLKQEGGAA